jgi:hypothetical protein
MGRWAAALVALLILPIYAHGQESGGSHTVVRDDTLWDLAQRYFSDPFQWRTIWNANRGVVEDPNWIYPDEVLTIPGSPVAAPAAGQPVADAAPRGPISPLQPAAQQPQREMVQGVPEELVPFGLRQARPVADDDRTVFYERESRMEGGVMAAAQREYVPVSADLVYSAPWMVRLSEEPLASGEVTGFARVTDKHTTIRSYDKIRITMDSPARVGAHLQLFRIERTVEGVGRVVVPTGVATVEALGDGEVVAIVTKEYDFMEVGNHVRPLPDFTPRAGVYAEEVSGGAEAMIMAFAGDHVLTDIGHVAFLDLGRADGLRIGDEFVLYGRVLTTDQEGTLQVVGLTDTMASARVVGMADNVFRQGSVVRLSKKMR